MLETIWIGNCRLFDVMNCTMKFRMWVCMLSPISEVTHIPKDHDKLWKLYASGWL